MPVVAVATSGGRDSTALLFCTVKAARALGVQVIALHVHHGLMPRADAWLAHVKRQAKRWGAAFDARRLTAAPTRGDSVEAWARRERYAALAEMAQAAGASLVLLAHHRRDQAETWLLQALRGGGPAGLSAMPMLAQRQGLVWARPWLEQPRSAIANYVRQHRLSFVEDSSNADPRFARSRLRNAVWPALQAAFADAEVALTQSARRAQEAQAVLSEVAEEDLAALLTSTALKVDPWLHLSPLRRLNALRTALPRLLEAPVPESLLRRLVNELPTARTGCWPAGHRELRLYRGLLSAHTVSAPVVDLRPVVEAPLVLDLDRAGQHQVLAWSGHWLVEPMAEHGVASAVLAGVQMRPRAGGERFVRTRGGMPRSLKLQYQAAAVPAWDRQGPLLFTAAGDLLFAPGLGLDARHWAPAGEPAFKLRWVTAKPKDTG